ncbi:MalY/PatB family protein [Candidatus Thiodictyon syntrophicum]|jgi:cystathionine beta-lyase|uniref:cysteine-S-conjugate beta-lyase n=1 Tax=Candidatus Thiodictyon syntrophicum TaxID=1166950 RepID=A0A2K8U7X0_9GAMM|nr:PatB family C-S lyase [Candidatus Thiodictyon syntrophicum]AUB81645.1 aminotransferase [Candidatus Thiodictyon syntrophicum]
MSHQAPDFDQPINREGTASLKWDGRAGQFGDPGVLPLWVADMDFAAPAAVTQALAERAAHPVYGYTLFPDALFTAMADWLRDRHGWVIERDWVLMAPGVVPSLSATVLALTEPGEGVIIQPPVYAPFFSVIRANGRRVVENPLRCEAGGYTFDLEHLERCAAEARLLILCSPHNPVGRVWSADELGAVLAIARRHRLVVLSDEIHHDLCFPGEVHRPLASLTDEPAAVITALAPSKTFNIPGLGLSAIICPDPEQRRALRRVFDSFHVSASNPFSVAAFTAAYREGGPWLDALMPYLVVNRDLALDFIARRLPGITAVRPQGTYLLWLDCRGLGLTDAALRAFFIERAGLGLSPGTIFGTGGSGHMRLNLGAPRVVIERALGQLAAALGAA